MVEMPNWAARFTLPARYKCAYGGRGSGKTTTAARILAAEAANTSLRIACCREFQNSIKFSAKPALEKAIYEMGLQDFYEITDQTIRGIGPTNPDTMFFFRGLERNREEIRGWEHVDRVWVEEAQRISDATQRVLIPTIRKPGSQIWFTWNPVSRTDWVWRRFIEHPRPKDVIQKVNWNDNPWFPDEADVERRADEKENPDMYLHIWNGEPDDEGQTRRVLPYAMVVECVEAYKRNPGLMQNLIGKVRVDGGLDVADTGDNYNALVLRAGPVIIHAEKWRAPIEGITARRADKRAQEYGAKRLYYDAGGVGAGVRSYFKEMTGRPYAVRPELFGGSIKGPKTVYSYRLTNEEFFARRNSQLGWALRVRGQRTRRWMNGEDVNPAKCLFINPYLEGLPDLMSQLAQPDWRENPTTGKTELIKRDEDEASPDLYDAAVLSFARDSQYGLQAR